MTSGIIVPNIQIRVEAWKAGDGNAPKGNALLWTKVDLVFVERMVQRCVDSVSGDKPNVRFVKLVPQGLIKPDVFSILYGTT